MNTFDSVYQTNDNTTPYVRWDQQNNVQTSMNAVISQNATPASQNQQLNAVFNTPEVRLLSIPMAITEPVITPANNLQGPSRWAGWLKKIAIAGITAAAIGGVVGAKKYNTWHKNTYSDLKVDYDELLDPYEKIKNPTLRFNKMLQDEKAFVQKQFQQEQQRKRASGFYD